MQAKANGKQALWVLLIALVLIVLCIGGLWVYVKSADAETGVRDATLAELPQENEIAIARERYDNYPLASEASLPGGSNFGWEQGKALIADEIRRLKELTEAYEEGMRPAEKAPSLPGEGGFAIIPLDPKEYAGIAEYYILPETQLSDKELLMLIDYGANAGVPFTEDTLTGKNCMRGNNTSSNRYLSSGESERRDILRRRVWMENLRVASPEPTLQTLPVAGMAGIRLNPDRFSRVDSFHLYPVRELTDEELLQSLYLDYMDGYTYLRPSIQNGLDQAADAARMRSMLEDLLGMPMAAENIILAYKQRDGAEEIYLHAKFKTALVNGRETEYTAILQRSTGDIVYALRLTSNQANPYLSFLVADPPMPKVDLKDPKWTDIAKEMVSQFTQTPIVQANVTGVSAMGDDREPNVNIEITLENRGVYMVNVRVSDGIVSSARYLHYDKQWINDYMW